MKKPTAADLEAFAQRCEQRASSYYAKMYPNLNPPTISVDSGGRKYKRIVSNNGTQRMIVCFIHAENGDVLKAATWKAPAKHARGNIFSEHGGMEGISERGTTAIYLS